MHHLMDFVDGVEALLDLLADTGIGFPVNLMDHAKTREYVSEFRRPSVRWL